MSPPSPSKEAGSSSALQFDRASSGSKEANQDAVGGDTMMTKVTHGHSSGCMTTLPLSHACLDRIARVNINAAAIDERIATLAARRGVAPGHEVAWLIRAIQCIDLTTLAGDDTKTNVRRLCCKALHPVQEPVVSRLGLSPIGLTTGAVCVYPSRIKDAAAYLKGRLPIASVAAGFPAGQTLLNHRLEEIRQAVKDGASEIDIVISREHVIAQNWKALYDEVASMRKSCGKAHLKTILATGELETLSNVYRASMICMYAGADVIKTSTGKESVNAILPVGLVMVRAIREFYLLTGRKVGFKPAGGIRTASDALCWLRLILDELGPEWTQPTLFRIGASSLLGDIENRLAEMACGHKLGGPLAM